MRGSYFVDGKGWSIAGREDSLRSVPLPNGDIGNAGAFNVHWTLKAPRIPHLRAPGGGFAPCTPKGYVIHCKSYSQGLLSSRVGFTARIAYKGARIRANSISQFAFKNLL